MTLRITKEKRKALRISNSNRQNPKGPQKSVRESRQRLQESREIIQTQKREYRKLQELNSDLNSQVRSLMREKQLSPEQEQDFSRLRQEHAEGIRVQAEIANYLRGAFTDEIARGDHAGMRLSDIVIMYLRRYRGGVQ